MQDVFFLVEESTEVRSIGKGFDVSIFTQAATLEELSKLIKDVVNCQFDDTKKISFIG